MEKSFLHGYVGVKFDTVCLDNKLPDVCKKYIPFFKKSGNLLLKHNMTPANAGNISIKYEKGFLITSSGCNLGCIEDDEVVFVEDYSIDDKMVTYRGSYPPSSESFLHGLLYAEKKDVLSIVHAHDRITTSMDLTGIICETEREEPYGTVELARFCIKTFGKGKRNIIVLKNHGYVAVGLSLNKTTAIVINMHKHLVHLKKT